MSGHEGIEKLKEWFPNIKHVRTENCQKVSQLIEYEWIDLEKTQCFQPNSKLCDDFELNMLVDIVKHSLEVQKNKSIMVFADNKKQVDRICEILHKAEIKNLPYYQDIGVQGRQTALQQFLRGEISVMVCTNLASRGLDTMGVQHVIQFDFAKNAIDYIHRVGRTGRMGQRGYVTNFIRKVDYELEQRIRETEQKSEAFDKIMQKKKLKKKKSDDTDSDDL